MRIRRQTLARAAFTLIELIVVIAIIAVLVALTTAAVVQVLNKGPEVQTRDDISQMETALATFKSKFKVYPPSYILLSNNSLDYKPASPDDGKNWLREHSIRALNRIWPQLDWTSGIDWSGGVSGFRNAILEGDQCLVFFLGGIPDQTNGGCLGFATNPKNPTAVLNPNAGRIPPFFTFPTDRLFQRNSNTQNTKYLPNLPATVKAFYSCQDAFKNEDASNAKVPYVYFSSNNRTNGYLSSTVETVGGLSAYLVKTSPVTDYHNAHSFQIISAGADGLYGAGGIYTPGSNPGGAAKDNLANFAKGRLAAAE
jgi:prepilin-type N-terminal cleavage/methylation domain-containing protein